MVTLPNPLVCSPEHVAHAVGVLYGDPNPARKAEANVWLTSFSSSPSSWEIGVQLLGMGSVEVQYFNANMLLTKIRTEWSRLTLDVQQNVSANVFKYIQEYMTNPSTAMVVVNRVCLVAAAVAVRTGVQAQLAQGARGGTLVMPPTVNWVIESCIQAAAFAKSGEQAEQTLAVAISLLLAVAEEVDAVDRCKREAVLAIMQGKVAEVLAMLEAVFSGQLGNGSCTKPKSRLLVPGLQLLAAWLKVDYSGCGRPVTTCGQLSQSCLPLWHFLLLSMASEELQAAEVAVEILVDLLASDSSGVPVEENAVRDVLRAILSQRQKLLKSFAEDEGNSNDIARGFCRVAVAATESAPELIACSSRGCEEAIPIAEMVLDCAEHGDRSTAEAAVEFFLMINTVPVAERPLPLQAALYGRLLQAILSKAAYHPEFTTWDEDPEDPDTFHRFREQTVADGLDTCYNLLRGQYLEFVGAVLKGATRWPEVEACLYAVRSVAQSLKDRVFKVRSPDRTQDPGIDAERQACEAFLSDLFTRLVMEDSGNGGLFTSHALLVEAVSRLVGAYALWFSWHTELLEGTLRYLLHALRVPGAWKHAAQAFRNVCVRCVDHLKEPTVLERLVDAAEASLPPVPLQKLPKGSETMSIEDRSAVVEGLARVIASLPPAYAPAVATRLAQPMVTSVQQLAAAGGEESQPLEEQVAALHIQLKLLSSAIRFLEFNSCPGSPKHSSPYQVVPYPPAPGPADQGREGEEHPCYLMMEMYWPILGRVLASRRWRREGDVVEALCHVYSRSLLCMKSTARPMLASLIPPLLAIFEEFQHEAVLETIATAMEVTYMDQDYALFSQALLTVCNTAFGILQRGELADKSEVVVAVFEMAYKYLLFSPALLLTSPMLQPLFQAAAAVILQQERESTRAALVFISHLLSPGEKALALPSWQEHRHMVDACAGHHGEALAGALLASAADTLPRHLMRQVASALYMLLTLYRTLAAGWLVTILGRPDFPGVQAGLLSNQHKALFCELALRQPPLLRPRFESMVTDFSNICRREGTGDALLAYQL